MRFSLGASNRKCETLWTPTKRPENLIPGEGTFGSGPQACRLCRLSSSVVSVSGVVFVGIIIAAMPFVLPQPREIDLVKHDAE